MTNHNNPRQSNEDILSEMYEDLFPEEWHRHLSKIIDTTLDKLEIKYGPDKFEPADIVEKIVSYNVEKRLNELSEIAERIPLPAIVNWEHYDSIQVFNEIHELIDACQVKEHFKQHKMIIIYGENVSVIKQFNLWSDCINEECPDICISGKLLDNNRIQCTIKRMPQN